MIENIKSYINSFKVDNKSKKSNVFLDQESSDEKKIKEIQNEIISFCRDSNNLQHINSFYDSSFLNQIDFNNCVTSSNDFIRKDLSKIESFKEKCLFENIESNVCMKYYDNLLSIYKEYMVDNKGVFIEFIDKKMSLE